MTAGISHTPLSASASAGDAGLGLKWLRLRGIAPILGLLLGPILGLMPVPKAFAETSGQSGATPGGTVVAPSPQQIDALAHLLLTTLQSGEGHGREQDLEGQLRFTIDQAQASCSLTQAALIEVQAMSGSLAPVAREALHRVQDAMARCQTNGTAALRGAQGALVSGTTLGLAGGTSNYLGSQ